MSWSDNINRFKKNWWKARLCRQCKFVHIGENVDHNHCDLRPETPWRKQRVNGQNRCSCHYFARLELK